MRKYRGKTLEEALDNASIEENVDIKYLNYTIIKQDENEVEIMILFVSDIIDFASKYVKTIINDLGIEVETKTSYQNEVIHINIQVSENSLLIGRNGVSLQALTELTRTAVNQEFKRHYHLLIDINSYKNNKYDKLIITAKRIAKEVRQTKAEVKLDPMTSDERRVIHNALSNYQNIKTESVGSGVDRSLVIKYVETKEVE